MRGDSIAPADSHAGGLFRHGFALPAALALLFLSIAVILIVRTPSPLVVVIAAISALAGGSIAAAVLRASRQDVCAVTVEM
ncbi:MAG: hypothetical protein ACXWH7_13030, partial [Thermoanaerobaculia bacterium]